MFLATSHDFSLPLKNPVLVFSLILFIILLAPILLRKIKIPSVVGLIIAGVIIGPNALNILDRTDAIVLFSTVGLLYIMFLAGLELDINEFIQNKRKSVVFGLLTFLCPILVGFLLVYYVLSYDFYGSLLMASMFSSHTLIAYPIVSKLGIKQKTAVTVAVGGTIITDTLVLILLAVITNATQGEVTFEMWARLVASFSILLAIIFYVFPWIARYFFKHIEGEKTSQYIFVLALVFLAAFFSELAGIEPIVGAFLAGLSLNRLIPSNSSLMNRIEFVGNALFIPFFLISVGMLVDLNALFGGLTVYIILGFMILISGLGKFSAAKISQLIYKFTNAETGVIYGLSSAHAAATLAIVLVGYQNLQLFNETVLNAAVLVILYSSLLSSFVSEYFGKKLAIQDAEDILGTNEKTEEERILVPISNPTTIENLIDFAIYIKSGKSKEPIRALAIVKDDKDAKERVKTSQKMLAHAIEHAIASDTQVDIITRIDLNVGSGISRTCKEIGATDIVLGWGVKKRGSDRIFGSTLDVVLHNTRQMVYVCHHEIMLNLVKKLHVIVPEYAEAELGFKKWIEKLLGLAKQVSGSITFYCQEKTYKRIEFQLNNSKFQVKTFFENLDDIREFHKIKNKVKSNDLVIFISARKGTLSYQSCFENIYDRIEQVFDSVSHIIIFPQQTNIEHHDYLVEVEDTELNLIQENIERLNRLSQNVRKIFLTRQNKEE